MTRHATRFCVLLVALLTASALAAAPVAGASAQLSGDQFEPNDDFQNATPITDGSYSGLTVEAGDVDVYAVDLDAGESLSAAVAFSHAEGDIDVALADATGQRIVAASESETDGESISYVAPSAGTYYFVVYGFAGASAAYDMTVATSGSQGDTETLRVETATNDTETAANDSTDLEPNDDFDSAVTVSSGTYSDLAIDENDVDVYALGLDAGESLSVTVTFNHSEGDLDAALVDATSRRTVAISESVTDNESISYVAPANGTYYLVVYGYQNATAPYNLSISQSGDAVADIGTETPVDNGTETPVDNGTETPVDGGNDTSDFEPNDEFENATVIADGNYTDLAIGTGDLDVYAVDLATGESLNATIEFNHSEGDLDMALVDSITQQSVAVSESTTDDESLAYVAPANGTYYLVVFGYQGASAAYDLAITTSGDDSADNRTATPTEQTATPDNRTEAPTDASGN